MSGPRSSGRQRMAPLAYWANERVVYKQDSTEGGLSVAGRSLLVADDKMRCVHELRRETSAEQAQREARCREVDDPVARRLGSLHL